MRNNSFPDWSKMSISTAPPTTLPVDPTDRPKSTICVRLTVNCENLSVLVASSVPSIFVSRTISAAPSFAVIE